MSRPVALVTGASAGIGREIARVLSDDHDLVLVARRADRLETLAAELPGTHRVEACDLTDRVARTALLDRIADVEVDVLVNNAGFGSHGPFLEQELDGELGQIELNVAALTHLTRELLPPMVARGRGHLLHIASIAAFQPGPYMAVYCATKAYVLSFSQALAYELRGTGVRVTAHCPGATLSEFGEIAGNAKTRLFTDGPAASSEEVARDAVAAMRQGQTVRVHGWMNKLLAFVSPRGPQRLVVRAAARINQA